MNLSIALVTKTVNRKFQIWLFKHGHRSTTDRKSDTNEPLKAESDQEPEEIKAGDQNGDVSGPRSGNPQECAKDYVGLVDLVELLCFFLQLNLCNRNCPMIAKGS